MCVTLSMFYILSVLCHNTLRQKSLFSASLSVRLIVSHSDKHTHTHAYTDTHFSLKLSTPSLPPSLYHSDSHARTHPRTQLCAHVSVTEPHARKFFLLSFSFSFSLSPPPAHFCDFNSLSLWHRSCHIAKTHEHNGEVNPFNATSPRKQSLVNPSDMLASLHYGGNKNLFTYGVQQTIYPLPLVCPSL